MLWPRCDACNSVFDDNCVCPSLASVLDCLDGYHILIKRKANMKRGDVVTYHGSDDKIPSGQLYTVVAFHETSVHLPDDIDVQCHQNGLRYTVSERDLSVTDELDIYVSEHYSNRKTRVRLTWRCLTCTSPGPWKL